MEVTPGKTVGEIGEREIIHVISQWVMQGQQDGNAGVGDDCATLDATGKGQLVTTTDLLIEGTHFVRNAATDWQAVGRKAAGANISDLSAMGATPAGLLVSIALPPDFPVADLVGLYCGIHEYAVPLNAPIIGGDTTRSSTVCISVTALGWKTITGAACLRSDAKPGDQVYVTGNLGASRAGVEVLLNPSLRKELGHDLAAKVVHCHHSPESRIHVGQALATILPRVAIIDISDSLYNEASLLAQASDVQIELNLDAIPIDPAALQFCLFYNIDPLQYALYSGEEYELLFAAPATLENIRDRFRDAGVECLVTHLGTVNPGSGVKLLKGGHPVDPKDETFVHFT